MNVWRVLPQGLEEDERGKSAQRGSAEQQGLTHLLSSKQRLFLNGRLLPRATELWLRAQGSILVAGVVLDTSNGTY